MYRKVRKGLPSEMKFVKGAFCKNCKYSALLTNKGDVGRHLPCCDRQIIQMSARKLLLSDYLYDAYRCTAFLYFVFSVQLETFNLCNDFLLALVEQ